MLVNTSAVGLSWTGTATDGCGKLVFVRSLSVFFFYFPFGAPALGRGSTPRCSASESRSVFDWQDECGDVFLIPVRRIVFGLLVFYHKLFFVFFFFCDKLKIRWTRASGETWRELRGSARAASRSRGLIATSIAAEPVWTLTVQAAGIHTIIIILKNIFRYLRYLNNFSRRFYVFYAWCIVSKQKHRRWALPIGTPIGIYL